MCACVYIYIYLYNIISCLICMMGLSLSCIVEENLANLLLLSLHVLCSFQNLSSAKSGRNFINRCSNR